MTPRGAVVLLSLSAVACEGEAPSAPETPTAPAVSSAAPIVFDPHASTGGPGTAETIVRDAPRDGVEKVPYGVRPVEPPDAVPLDDGTGLPSHGDVPAFTLTDQDGAAFTERDLLGDVWVVDFMFTRCAGICIPMTRAIVAMQRDGLAARFLSISVDPDHDTPEVLAAYRRQWDGDPARWTLLTGDDDLVTGLSEGGFALPVQVRRDAPVEGLPTIFHSGRFALVDRQGRVRGFFDHRDKDELAALRDAIAALAEA